LVKNKNWFLTTDDYTSLYFQYTYMAFIIYKYIYKYGEIFFQMRKHFMARAYGAEKVPEILVLADYR